MKAQTFLAALFALVLAPPAPADEATSRAAALARDLARDLDRNLAAAEDAVAHGEVEVAESRYREALRTGFEVLGGLAATSGDLQAARDAFEQGLAAAGPVRAALVPLARAELGLGRYDEAGNLLDDAVARYPDDAEVRFLFAQALAADGRTEEALEELVTVGSLPVVDGALERRSGELRERLTAALAEEKATGAAVATTPTVETPSFAGLPTVEQEELGGRAEAARARARFGLALLDLVGPLPASAAAPPADVAAALRRLAAGDGAGAEAALGRIVAERASIRALLPLARLQAGRGEPKAALATLRRALEQAPSSVAVLSAYARLNAEMGWTAPAILTLRALVRMQPAVADHPYRLGLLRMQAGDVAGALEDLEKARALRPRHPPTLVALGRGDNELKRYAEAVEVLREALRLEPESLEVMASLAEAEQGIGELEAAEEHARRVLDRVEDPTARLALGMVLMKQELFAEAIDTLRTLVALHPDAAKAHYQLSLAYARLGDLESSRQHRELYEQSRKEVENRLRPADDAPVAAPDGRREED